MRLTANRRYPQITIQHPKNTQSEIVWSISNISPTKKGPEFPPGLKSLWTSAVLPAGDSR